MNISTSRVSTMRLVVRRRRTVLRSAKRLLFVVLSCILCTCIPCALPSTTLAQDNGDFEVFAPGRNPVPRSNTRAGSSEALDGSGSGLSAQAGQSGVGAERQPTTPFEAVCISTSGSVTHTITSVAPISLPSKDSLTYRYDSESGAWEFVVRKFRELLDGTIEFYDGDCWHTMYSDGPQRYVTASGLRAVRDSSSVFTIYPQTGGALTFAEQEVQENGLMTVWRQTEEVTFDGWRSRIEYTDSSSGKVPVRVFVGERAVDSDSSNNGSSFEPALFIIDAKWNVSQPQRLNTLTLSRNGTAVHEYALSYDDDNRLVSYIYYGMGGSAGDVFDGVTHLRYEDSVRPQLLTSVTNPIGGKTFYTYGETPVQVGNASSGGGGTQDLLKLVLTSLTVDPDTAGVEPSTVRFYYSDGRGGVAGVTNLPRFFGFSQVRVVSAGSETQTRYEPSPFNMFYRVARQAELVHPGADEVWQEEHYRYKDDASIRRSALETVLTQTFRGTNQTSTAVRYVRNLVSYRLLEVISYSQVSPNSTTSDIIDLPEDTRTTSYTYTSDSDDYYQTGVKDLVSKYRVTTPNGEVISKREYLYTLDGQRSLERRWDNGSNSWIERSWTYDENMQLTRYEGAAGDEASTGVSYTYDRETRLLASKTKGLSPLEFTIRYDYDPVSLQLAKETSDSGRERIYLYDGLFRVIAKKDRVGIEERILSEFTYSPSTRQTTERYLNGSVKVVTTDGFGAVRKTSYMMPDGTYVSTQNGASNQGLTTRETGQFTDTSIQIDGASLQNHNGVTSVKDPVTRLTVSTPDTMEGLPSVAVIPSAAVPSSVSFFGITSRNPQGVETQAGEEISGRGTFSNQEYAYLGAGDEQLVVSSSHEPFSTTESHPAGDTKTHFNSLGQQTYQSRLTDSDSRSTYTKSSLPYTTSYPNGDQEMYSYDAVGRLMERRYSNTASNAELKYTYKYDEPDSECPQCFVMKGQLASVTGPYSKEWYSYSVWGELITQYVQDLETKETWETYFSYNEKGQLVATLYAVNVPGESDPRIIGIIYQYDQIGRITAISRLDEMGNLQLIAKVTEWTNGRPTQIQYDHGGTESFEFSSTSGELLSTTTRSSTGAISAQDTFKFNETGKLESFTTVTDKSVKTTFEYNSRGEAVGYRYDEEDDGNYSTHQHTLEFDAQGRVIGDTELRRTYAYEDDKTPLFHDSAVSLDDENATTKRIYNERKQLVQVTTTGSGPADSDEQLTYSPEGKLIQRKLQNVTVNYRYSHDGMPFRQDAVETMSDGEEKASRKYNFFNGYSEEWYAYGIANGRRRITITIPSLFRVGSKPLATLRFWNSPLYGMQNGGGSTNGGNNGGLQSLLTLIEGGTTAGPVDNPPEKKTICGPPHHLDRPQEECDAPAVQKNPPGCKSTLMEPIYSQNGLGEQTLTGYRVYHSKCVNCKCRKASHPLVYHFDPFEESTADGQTCYREDDAWTCHYEWDDPYNPNPDALPPGTEVCDGCGRPCTESNLSEFAAQMEARYGEVWPITSDGPSFSSPPAYQSAGADECAIDIEAVKAMLIEAVELWHLLNDEDGYALLVGELGQEAVDELQYNIEQAVLGFTGVLIEVGGLALTGGAALTGIGAAVAPVIAAIVEGSQWAVDGAAIIHSGFAGEWGDVCEGVACLPVMVGAVVGVAKAVRHLKRVRKVLGNAPIGFSSIAGLGKEQFDLLVRISREKGATGITFGGSRVRGDFHPGSDLDVGFQFPDSLSDKAISGKGGLLDQIHDAYNAELTRLPHGRGHWLPLESLRIGRGLETESIPRVSSPEEFFNRSGVRGPKDPRAGESFSPSGSVTFMY